MKILMINVVCGIRSTGRICTDLAAELEKQGHEVKIAYGREEVPAKFQKYAVRIGNEFDVKLHGVKARLFDQSGFGSKAATTRFIQWVRQYDPDVVHLHNIHGYYINIEVLFEYLKTSGKKIIWTLHDCWAFTGHAAYCEAADCQKWVSGCGSCPKRSDYPKSLTDNSASNWLRKKDLFSDIPDMTIVTPSDWLAGLVKRSFLSRYPVTVINNGIDTGIFKPVQSNLREQLRAENKIIILGVASVWDERKGLRDFLRLYELLDKNRYLIILAGLSERQKKELPDGIIGFARTDSARQLVELYSTADVFVNPTYEDNYPTTNLEAIACGTPVITYDTGGSPESAQMYGLAVPKGNVGDIAEAIAAAGSISKGRVDCDGKTAIRKYMAVYLKKVKEHKCDMNQPLISIILPVYNSEPFLKSCLSSIAKQTYRNFEVLIVDDASTDDSLSIAEEFAASDTRFKVFHRETNGGAAAARNLALDHAQGEYYAFVDSDDWIGPELLEAFITNAIKYDADITITSGYYREYADKCKIIETIRSDVTVLTKEKAMRELIVTGGINHMLWTKLFKKCLFDGMRFSEGNTLEDHELVWRLFSNAEKFVVIPCCYYHYYQFSNSVTHSHSLKKNIDRWLVNKEIFDQLSSVDDEYYHSLLRQCGNAITIVWCSAYPATKEEKNEFKTQLQEMCSFCKKHCREVMFGKYPIITTCILGLT